MPRALALSVFASLTLACAAVPPCPADSPAVEAEAVIAAVDAVFAAMREHDVEALRERMIEGAVIVAVHEQEGVPGPHRLISAEEFIAGTAGDLSITIDERFTSTPQVRVERGVASLWGPYEVFVDGERRHCGVDTVQLVLADGAWRVTAITYCAHPCA